MTALNFWSLMGVIVVGTTIAVWPKMEWVVKVVCLPFVVISALALLP